MASTPTVSVPPLPNYDDALLALDLNAPPTPPGYAPKLSIPWYQYLDRLHKILIGLVAPSPFPSVITNETGANNAIACPAASGPALTVGLAIQIKLAHTLQIGVNSLAYNGGVAIPIRSHRNPALNIATVYGVGGIIELLYDGTVWQDLSQ